jgi:hypothetical protein
MGGGAAAMSPLEDHRLIATFPHLRNSRVASRYAGASVLAYYYLSGLTLVGVVASNLL